MNKKHLLYSALAALLSPLAASAADNGSDVFRLGTVTVSAAKSGLGEVAPEQASSVVTRQDMDLFERATVAEAVNLLAGVSTSIGTRNERNVYVRGFDPRQVPLFIDGIPVYVPYDGYVDFDRFDTADLSAIQVAKGFSSVTYGANTLGGAINLISRRPTKEFEGDVKVGFGDNVARRASVNLGTNQGLWYLQTGASLREADGFRLSSDFQPTASEDGGRRDNSYYSDKKLSIKVGVTPRENDEYALSYTKQDGEKGQPPSTNANDARYWQWPYWNKESVYFISSTDLSARETLKARAYVDKFENAIHSFTDGTYSVPKTSGKGSVGSGQSMYNDKTHGGSLELATRRLENNTLRASVHYKEDQHEATDAKGTLESKYKDTMVSLGIEDNIDLTEQLMLSVGYAKHQLTPDLVYNKGDNFALPGKQTAEDVQAGLFYDLTPDARLYATAAQKTRLPTLKDRYSLRLDRYIENRDLEREKAYNYEIGYQGEPWTGARAEAALFWSDVSDKIQSTYVTPGASGGCRDNNKCQMQNVGKVRYKGIELGLTTAVGEQFELGGNLTLMDSENTSNKDIRMTDVPDTKVIVHGLWRALPTVDLVALSEYNSSRWTSDTDKVSAFTTFDVKAAWRPMTGVTTNIGVTNLTDKNYQLSPDFPQAGRSWFANIGYEF